MANLTWAPLPLFDGGAEHGGGAVPTQVGDGDEQHPVWRETLPSINDPSFGEVQYTYALIKR